MDLNDTKMDLHDIKTDCTKMKFNDKNKRKNIDINNNKDKKIKLEDEKKIKVNKNEDDENDNFNYYTEGICCFCGNECNPLSQSCGKCARIETMKMFGWYKN